MRLASQPPHFIELLSFNYSFPRVVMNKHRIVTLLKTPIKKRYIFVPLAIWFVWANLNFVKYSFISTKKLAHPNPTSYVFHVSSEKLIEAAWDNCDWGKCTGVQHEDCPNDDGLTVRLTTKSFFFQHGVPYDYTRRKQLFMDPQPFWRKSQTYFWNGKPLDYDADYQVSVTPVGESLTEVRVGTTNAVVDIGPVFTIGDGGNLARRVASTTIEEYRFLLTLGCIVGETGMPPLQLPH